MKTLKTSDPAPLHWLARWGDNPPVDIRFNPISGKLQSVNLVFHEELVTINEMFYSKLNSQPGVPIFDRTLWNSNPDAYVIENPNVKIGWSSENEIFVGIGNTFTPTGTQYKMDGDLSLLTDSSYLLRGIYISNITEAEKSVLRNLKLI